MKGRVYNLSASRPEVTDEEREAARRMVARRVTDPAERADLEDMLGITS